MNEQEFNDTFGLDTQLFRSVEIDYAKYVDEVKNKLNIEITEDEAKIFYIDFQRAMEVEKCKECRSLDDCMMKVKWFVFNAGRNENKLHFYLMKCERYLINENLKNQLELLNSCNIPELYKSKSVKSFMDTKGTERAKEVANEMIQNKKRRGVIFCGPTGTGKTHLAISVIMSRIEQGDTGLYITAPDLFDELRASYDEKGKTEKIRLTIRETGLLCIDDLGAEKPTEFVIEELFKFLNYRMLNKRQTIITTNYNKQELTSRLGVRIVSRISEMCEFVETSGPDWRMSGMV